jgi:hypothetical protein
MIELVTTMALMLGSMALLAYWFRYSCALIVGARTTRDFASDMVAVNNLAFTAVQAGLQQANPADLTRLQDMLDRDYVTLNKMLEATSGIEETLLRANYRFLNVWYRVSKPFSVEMARKALDEMSMVVAHFANVAGERAACGA